MIATKFGPLESLVGRTFERDGKRRTIVFVGHTETWWLEPGQDSVQVRNEGVVAFLSGAVEVKDGQG